MGRKFGENARKPSGQWVQFSLRLNVAGVLYRKHKCFAFAKAVEKAELKGRQYGIRLVPEPKNPHDKQAIRIDGYAERKTLFGANVGVWHIGYVPAEVALDIAKELISNALPYTGLLKSIYINNGFIDIQFCVLAPQGHSFSSRERRAKNSDAFEMAQRSI